MKGMKINQDVPLDNRGQNANIKFHIKDEETMKSLGFGFTYGEWLFSLGLTDTISLNIHILENEEGIIQILDDDFLQPYDFQNMIIEKGNKAPSVAKKVQNEVYIIMCSLSANGIISGWSIGDYI